MHVSETLSDGTSRDDLHENPREPMWRAMLTSEAPFLGKRRVFSRVPSTPRCKLCAAPFGLPGKLWMERIGHQRWKANPRYCAACFGMIRDNHGGAEVECSLIFADVRGSTPMAERMRPAEFNRLMGRFYDTATAVLVAHDAIVDKFVGDEVVGFMVPSMAGADHARRAIEAAETLLRRTGHTDPGGPWVPVGVGVNTGIAYVGSVGEGLDSELTALGDAVNTTARLGSAAGMGEILVTDDAIASAGLSSDRLERRSLELKGKSQATHVHVLKVAPG
jgi:adenylate cyclase